jgi:hypothetical protein
MYFSLVSLQLLPEINFMIKGRWFGTKFFKRIEKVDTATTDSTSREKEITTLSFLTGVCVAYLFNADFFNILKHISSGKNATSIPLSWPEHYFPLAFAKPYFNFENFYFDSAYCFGILLTGFFLSFGSKFFHDLLETLFYAKKAKAALSDLDTYKLDSADKIEKWVNDYDLEKFYFREAKNILNRNGLTAVGIGQVQFEGAIVNGLRIYAQQDHQKIESLLQIDQEKNIRYKVPYEIFVVDKQITPSAGLTIRSNLEITNLEHISKFGAITHPVEVAGQDGNYLLTCYHVVKTDNYNWEKYTSKNGRVAVTNNSDLIIGNIIAGGRTSFAEAALIKLDEGNKVATSFYPGFKISQKDARVITKDDVGTKVLMYQKSSNSIVAGIIASYDIITKVYFDGADRSPFVMNGLIEVQNSEGQPIQEEGDSGNLLFDEEYRPIGIVFAKNNLTTFVMRLDRAFNVFHGYKVSLKL